MFVKIVSNDKTDNKWHTTFVEGDFVHCSEIINEDLSTSILVRLERVGHQDRTWVFGSQHIKNGQIHCYLLNNNGKTIDTLI